MKKPISKLLIVLCLSAMVGTSFAQVLDSNAVTTISVSNANKYPALLEPAGEECYMNPSIAEAMKITKITVSKGCNFNTPDFKVFLHIDKSYTAINPTDIYVDENNNIYIHNIDSATDNTDSATDNTDSSTALGAG